MQGPNGPRFVQQGRVVNRISSLYNMAWVFAAPILLPSLFLAKKIKGERCLGVRERLSLLRPGDCAKGSTIWCHAISVGELNALLPVARAIRDKNPSLILLITTQTAAGLEAARRRFPFAQAVQYAPLDHPWVLKRFVRLFRPTALLVMETGYWPNMLSQTSMQGALSILAQARMSEKSFRRWKRFPNVFRWLVNFFQFITVEDLPTHDRFVSVGADKKRLRILPNTKYDSLEVVPEEERILLRQRLGLEPHDPILVAGSTHSGEERELLMAYQTLRAAHPRAILILAPRRLERLEQVRHQVAELGLPLKNLSSLHSGSPGPGVIITDTMGELAKLYSIATVAFVGNSLFPPGGGHSLLEPAIQGVPVLHGPYIENSAGPAAQLGQLGAAHVVRGFKDVIDQVNRILEAPEESRAASLRARQWIDSQRGASSTLAELLLENLKGANPAH
jgi:3-deoxy-D-manno-octulosonic-acid transferase